jgi:hypothetical protein
VGLGHNGEVANNLTVSGTIYGNFDSTQGTVDLLTVVNTLYANDISLSGNLSGNLIGNASTVTNGVYTTSSINALADVDTATSLPTNGQALVWNGTNWVPGSVAAGGGNLDFGTFASPEGFTLDLGSF